MQHKPYLAQMARSDPPPAPERLDRAGLLQALGAYGIWGVLPIFFFAVFVVLIATEPQWTLLVLAYTYLLSAFIGQAITRVRGRRGAPPPAPAEH